MSVNNTEVCSLLGVHGACELVVKGVLQHIDCPDEVQWGLYSIGFLHSEDSPEGVNRERLRRLGVHELVLRVLRRHVHHSGVAEKGLRSIAFLCHENEEVADADNASIELFASLGGCKLVVDAMRLHMDDADLVGSGVIAICNLCFVEDVVQSLGEVGACQLVVEVLQRNTRNKAIVEDCSNTMYNLMNSNDSNRAIMLSVNVADVCVRAFEISLVKYQHRNSDSNSDIDANIGGLIQFMRECLDWSEEDQTIVSETYKLFLF